MCFMQVMSRHLRKIKLGKLTILIKDLSLGLFNKKMVQTHRFNQRVCIIFICASVR